MRTQASGDVVDAIEQLARRIYLVEQASTSPDNVGGNNTFETIVLGPSGSTVTVGTGVTPPPSWQASSPSVGAIYENVYINAAWNAPVDGSAVGYIVEFAEKNAGVYTVVETRSVVATNVRANGLKPNQTYGVRVYSVNRIGQISATALGYADVTTGTDTTIPPQVTGLQTSRGATSLVVVWTPLTAAQAPDVANGNGWYLVQIATNSGFSTGLREVRTAASIVAFNDLTAEGAYYARVAAIDASGNQSSVWSSTVGPITAGAVNNSMILADLSAAKVTVGEMHGDRIQAHTMLVNRITSSDITTAILRLNGGSLIAGANPGNPSSGQGMIINSQGIRLYNSTGQITISLDALTGNGTFSGTISGSTVTGTDISGGTITGSNIQTAASGSRISLGPAYTGVYAQHAIKMYSNKSPVETTPAEISTFWDGIYLSVGIGPGSLAGWSVPSLSMQSGALAADAQITLSAPGAIWVLGNFNVGSGYTATFNEDTTLNANGSTSRNFWASGGAKYIRYGDQSGTWDNQSLRAEGTGVVAGISFLSWSASNGMILRWNSSVGYAELTNHSVGAYVNLRANNLAIPSGLQSKIDVRDLSERRTEKVLGRFSDNGAEIENFSQAIKQMRPVRFKRPVQNDCAVCDGTGRLTAARAGFVKHALKDKAKAGPCPACSGARASKRSGGQRMAEESDSFGFVAEEMVQIFPEVCTYDENNNPDGIFPLDLIPPVVATLQELIARVENLENMTAV